MVTEYKEQDLQYLCVGTIGAILDSQDTQSIQINEFDKQLLLNPSMWSLKAVQPLRIVINPSSYYLMEFKNQFFQIRFYVENGVVTRIDMATDELKRFKFEEECYVN